MNDYVFNDTFTPPNTLVKQSNQLMQDIKYTFETKKN